ncbi:MAG: transcription termination/antitermination factor NusG [Candidatus Eisenbacteria bacterium]|nr:transcription termination/antitermination factor NusG [Candidatus Eisenbacteria bacterium]
MGSDAAALEAPEKKAADAPAEAPAAEEKSQAESGEAEPAPEPKPKSRKRWYVVHTYSGHENKVRANLERAIQYHKMQDRFGEILVATEDYVVVKGGKKHITKRKTFPSYVLVEMEMNDETRALVTSIPGVTHFVGDKNAAPLTEAEVARIRGEEVEEKGQVTTEVPFKVGESVRVTEGPFADFVGTVDEINLERGKLRVMVSIFGRATAVELDIMHVTSV